MRTWWLAGAAAVAAAVVSAVPAAADHGDPGHPPGDPTRSFELVSPAYKVSGAGVGLPPNPLHPYKVQSQAAGAGAPAYVGERFAVGSHLGGTMLDSEFATSNDWAFAQRVSDTVGWRSHAPNTHPFRCSEDYRMQQLQQAAPDFSTVLWNSNAGDLPFFAEMCELGNTNNGASLISDWGSPPESATRWEPIGPLDVSQSFRSIPADTFFTDPAISADGSYLAVSGLVRGLAGGGGFGCVLVAGVWVEVGSGEPCPDPTVDTLGGNGTASAYVDDISAGLSDTWPGAGVRTPAAACTGDDAGSGQARTRIPARNGDGSLGEVACDDPEPDRGSRLVSAYGSQVVMQNDRSLTIGTSNTNVISADGSRTFFMAPDPRLTGSNNPGATGCSGADTGTASRCPAQLYVRQRNGNGEVVTRWVSRPEQGLLDAGYPVGLLGSAIFEGASEDGGRVFFRTASKLTADDPNGGSATVRSNSSWDLYMFELAPGPDPTGPGSSLTRVSAGPDGTADCNNPQGDVGSFNPLGNRQAATLRFVAADGSRVYFSCAAPLGGVADRGTGTPAGEQGGTPTIEDQANIYLYDLNVADPAERYTFVARIPRTTGSITTVDELTRCASIAALTGTPMHTNGFNRLNCWRGTDDGAFATFWTAGRLTADDPDELGPGASADIYAYDAASDELIRISAPQGATDETYDCLDVACYADLGLHSGHSTSEANSLLNVVTDPQPPGEQTVFFESASRLIDADQNDAMDVYRWRDGELSLVSSGAAGSRGAAYKGNSADGRNVYLLTYDSLTWQDVDSVADVYTARVGGGIPQPDPPPVCAVLAGACRGPDAPAAVSAPLSKQPGGGDASPGVRKRLVVGGLSRVQRRRAARSGVLRLRVRVNAAGRAAVVVRGRVGKRVRRVGRGARTLGRPGAVTVRVRLSGAARRQLRRRGALRLVVRVRARGALARSRSVVLRRAGR